MARKTKQVAEKGMQFLGTAMALGLVFCLAVRSETAAANKGTLSTYTSGTNPATTASFVNISGQMFINAVAGPRVPFSNTAGGDWEGLNNTPFQSLSFDVKGSPGSFFVIFHGADAKGVSLKRQDETIEFFGSNEFSSGVDLHNGFTRYTIKQGARSFANHLPTLATVNRIVFHQYAAPSAHPVVFGNIILNGAIKPVTNMTKTACPAVTGDGR